MSEWQAVVLALAGLAAFVTVLFLAIVSAAGLLRRDRLRLPPGWRRRPPHE